MPFGRSLNRMTGGLADGGGGGGGRYKSGSTSSTGYTKKSTSNRHTISGAISSSRRAASDQMIDAGDQSDHSSPPTGSELPADAKGALHTLFSQIETEYVALYMENQSLKAYNRRLEEKIAALTAGAASGGGNLETTSMHNRDATSHSAYEEVNENDNKSRIKASSSQVAQRIKTTYRASTNKIVSSFKGNNTQSTGSRSSRGVSFQRLYKAHKDGVWDVSVSIVDGSIVVGSASADRTARLWSTDSGSPIFQYSGHTGSVNSIRMHPRENIVVTASGDSSVHCWRFSRDRIRSFRSDSATSAACNNKVPHKISSGDDDLDDDPCKDVAVTGGLSESENMDPMLYPGGCGVASWTQQTAQHPNVVHIREPDVALADHTQPVVAADFLYPDADRVVTGSWDMLVRLCDVVTGRVLRVNEGHEGCLTNVSTHPSQSLYVSSSEDRTFRIWDYNSPQVTSVCEASQRKVRTAAFAGNHRIVSGSDDNSLRIWDMRNMSSPEVSIRTNGGINRLAISHEHKIVACPLDNRSVRLYSLDGTRVASIPYNGRQGCHQRLVTSVAWCSPTASSALTPTLDWLFTCSFDGVVASWHVNSAHLLSRARISPSESANVPSYQQFQFGGNSLHAPPAAAAAAAPSGAVSAYSTNPNAQSTAGGTTRRVTTSLPLSNTNAPAGQTQTNKSLNQSDV